MKNFFLLFLMLATFLACETDANFETNSVFQSEAQLLFSIDEFEHVEHQYPLMNRATMDASLTSYIHNGQTMYSMDIVNNTSIDKVDQSQLYFTIENNQVDKILIIESATIEGTDDVRFSLRNLGHQVFSEFTITKTDKAVGIQWQTRSCFDSCIAEAIEQCTENPIVVIGCTIANQFIITGCALQCAADSIGK